MKQSTFRLSRRVLLSQTACGFGSLAAAALASQASSGGATAAFADSPRPHFAPRARRIIFLFMQGGVSQVDSFDYKPQLAKYDGQMLGFEDARIVANTGNRSSSQRVMASPWKFRQHGESGRWVSELFPHLAQHVDRICFVHSLSTEGVAHGPATLFLHCGSTNLIRPSMGSWIAYGLGSENENMPGYVSITPSIGNGGARNYGSAFLPPVVQGTALGRAGASVSSLSIRHLVSQQPKSQQRQQLDLLEELNQAQAASYGNPEDLEAVIASYELAWRMQSHAPEVLDLSQETAGTRARYGLDMPATHDFGLKCLLARRLCEAGVRFIQVNYGDNSANPAWDQHSNLPKHADHAAAVDQPIAALLDDLDRRGLLDETLVWWGGEFGRTPYAEKNGTGRDHNPGGFTVWLAGGGIKPGFAYGATDEFGGQATEDRVHMHDLHATMLHALGLDHERLTYAHAGRNFRLTDVHGHVIHELFG